MGRAARLRKAVHQQQSIDHPPISQLAVSKADNIVPVATHNKASGFVSVVFWFLVLLYGFTPLAHKPTTEFVPQVVTRFKHNDSQAPTAAVNLISYLDAPLGLDPHSLLAQFESVAACKHNASLIYNSKPFDCQQSTLYPELANLVDLCPWFIADPAVDQGTIYGSSFLCDDNHYRMPCTDQYKGPDRYSLVNFASWCYDNLACRAWWLQQHYAGGICGCSFSVVQQDPNQQKDVASYGSSKDAQSLADVEPARMSMLKYMLWLVFPIGMSGASLVN